MTWVRELINETIRAGNMKDAFYVCNVDDIFQKHRNWNDKMMNITPFYAVKCNSNRIVLETLAALGIGFDCASKGEIDMMLAMGVHPKKIIYANPCKSSSFIQHSRDVGVKKMTFDNEDELRKIKDNFPEAELVLRLKVDDSGSKCPLGSKFGARMERVEELLAIAASLSLSVIGVSFHVGSGCGSSTAYKMALKDSRAVFDLGLCYGFEMNFLDIGGGFPGGSDPKEKALFDDIVMVVKDNLQAYFPVKEFPQIEIIAEPGRYYVASAFTLTTNIIAKRVEYAGNTLDDSDKVMMYYLNDGVYGSFSNLSFEEGELIPIPEIRDNELSSRKVYPAIIWGPTCDSLDCIQKRIFLPEMHPGEWMTFTDMGAYSISCGTHFNGFTMPVVKVLASPETILWFKELQRLGTDWQKSLESQKMM
jgi:ornithine decarboxylase